MKDFCCANLNAKSILVAVAGRATIHEWRCVDGDRQVVKQIFETDSQDDLSDFWHELTPHWREECAAAVASSCL